MSSSATATGRSPPAVAVAFLVLLVGPIAIYQHYSTEQLEA